MDWNRFLQKLGDTPLISTENLRAFQDEAGTIEVQVSRWTKAGKLLQLRRGVYVIAPPYRRTDVFEPFVANVLKSPSYISLEKALEFHGLIPEAVPVVTSLTTKRQGRFQTPVGNFSYRHIQPSYFWGYTAVSHEHQMGYVARPEKALLDLIYLNNLRVTPDYLEGMRFQNIEKMDSKVLLQFAGKFNKPSLEAAAKAVASFLKSQRKGEKKL